MSTAGLVRLADTDMVLATPADDVRGKPVLDRDGADIGEVDDLVVDEDERRVRLLQVGSGGFLGIGKRKVLIPVDAVTAVDHAVHVDTDRGHVANGPVYDPDLVLGKNIVAELYDYYGMLPYWNRR